ncbi:hypothetical protein GOODEAATRI_030997 [Goodea atripinnis]|uniref:Uncharacterized protein n=1 Tax=Goodea atripinnis TaxID=208336 RepID=A0ABV0PT61_9TELE
MYTDAQFISQIIILNYFDFLHNFNQSNSCSHQLTSYIRAGFEAGLLFSWNTGWLLQKTHPHGNKQTTLQYINTQGKAPPVNRFQPVKLVWKPADLCSNPHLLMDRPQVEARRSAELTVSTGTPQ